jgi:hypothetical protein
MKLRSNWGQRTHIEPGLQVSQSHEFRTEGQVGQESNLQPAVLEPAAVRSPTFRGVHEGV